MIDLPYTVEIRDVKANSNVVAAIDELTVLEAQKMQERWWKGIPTATRNKTSDSKWNWANLVSEVWTRPLVWECLGIEKDGNFEAAIRYRVDGRSQLNRSVATVYVDRLAVAPRNRKGLFATPRYLGVGEQLLLSAVQHSYLLGFGGRVWLQSFPDPNTVRFYTKHKFRRVRTHADGMIDFELADADAQLWLNKWGRV